MVASTTAQGSGLRAQKAELGVCVSLNTVLFASVRAQVTDVLLKILETRACVCLPSTPVVKGGGAEAQSPEAAGPPV